MVKPALKLAVMALNDPKGRKVIGVVVAIILFFVLLIPTFIYFLIFGSFGAVIAESTIDSTVTDEWDSIRKALRKGIAEGDDVEGEVATLLFDYVPNLEYDISKAIVEEAVNEKQEDVLLLCYLDELERAKQVQSEVVEDIKNARAQSELDALTKGTDSDGFLRIDVDNKLYMNNMRLENCSAETQKLVSDLVRYRMPSYSYREGSGFDRYGRPTQSYRLVITESGKYRMLAYTITGDGIIYLPKFLATYYASQGVSVENNYTTAINTAIESMKDLSGELESYEDLQEHVAKLGLEILVTDAFKIAVSEMFASGAIKVTADTKEYVTGERYDVEVIFPTGEEWYSFFAVSAENTELVAKNEEMIIQLLELTEAEEDLNFDVTEHIDVDYIRYAEGLFLFPIEDQFLAEDPILSTMGGFNNIHKYGIKKETVYEQGVTLNLNKGSAPVVFKLSELGTDVIDNVYIYDVYNSSAHAVSDSSVTYNCSAVQLAVVIDTDKYKRMFDCDFPFVDSNIEKVTVLIEYNCLNSVTISENDIGKSLFDVIDENGIIGYTHTGKHNSLKDDNPTSESYYHSIADSAVYHVSIKSAVYDSQAAIPRYTGDGTYNGLSEAFIGVQTNPLYWFDYSE